MRHFHIILLVALLLPLVQFSDVHADSFVLLGSYPAQGQTVEPSDLVNNAVYLKFNHPLNRSSEGAAKFLDKNVNSICQFDLCGIVEYAENDTEMIWHPNNPGFLFQPGSFFELQLDGLEDTSGNSLPATYIDFSVDKCQPTANLNILYSNWKYCVCDPLGLDCHFNGTGNTFTLVGGIANPSCSKSTEVEVKCWVELPDGSLLSVFDPQTTVQVMPKDSISGNLFSYTFQGSEPIGNYKFFLRLVNPLTGDLYSTSTATVSFGVCPAMF